MSNLLFDLENMKQNFKPPHENKILFGEVNTPFSLIHEMLNLFPKSEFKDPNKRWLDPAAGCGYFPMVLFNKLMDGLKSKIRNGEKRKRHILENMIYMCEINPNNIATLRETFGKHANIYNLDFLSTSTSTFTSTVSSSSSSASAFDNIIGNPPYNANGMKKVPTNNQLNKRQDGVTLWTDFVKHSMSLLRPNGYLSFIIPAIWMKPDKAGMHQFIKQFKLHKLRAFTNTETKLLFKNQAQTPTCYFLLERTNNNYEVSLYSHPHKAFKKYKYDQDECLPLSGCTIVEKVKQYARVEQAGTFKVIKTNLPSKHNTLRETEDAKHRYANVKICTLDKDGVTPVLKLEYSSKPCAHYGEKKIIMGHKMYGFPYLDLEGKYGISNRDNYVILGDGYTDQELKQICAFLNTKLALYLYETTRYRMKYLEKYVFSFIPDVTKLSDIPGSGSDDKEITDKALADYFGLTDVERNAIKGLHKKVYKSF
jgi:tRNA1(Val) A37 N6-methylase TrmN6